MKRFKQIKAKWERFVTDTVGLAELDSIDFSRLLLGHTPIKCKLY